MGLVVKIPTMVLGRESAIPQNTGICRRPHRTRRVGAIANLVLQAGIAIRRTTARATQSAGQDFVYLADIEIHPENARKEDRKDTMEARAKQIRIAPNRRVPPGAHARNPERRPSREAVYLRLAD